MDERSGERYLVGVTGISLLMDARHRNPPHCRRGNWMKEIPDAGNPMSINPVDTKQTPKNRTIFNPIQMICLLYRTKLQWLLLSSLFSCFPLCFFLALLGPFSVSPAVKEV